MKCKDCNTKMVDSCFGCQDGICDEPSDLLVCPNPSCQLMYDLLLEEWVK